MMYLTNKPSPFRRYATLLVGAVALSTLCNCAGHKQGFYDPDAKGPDVATNQEQAANEEPKKEEKHELTQEEQFAKKTVKEGTDLVRLFRDENQNQIDGRIEGFYTLVDRQLAVRYYTVPCRIPELGVPGMCQIDPRYNAVPIEKAYKVSAQKLKEWYEHTLPKLIEIQNQATTEGFAERAKARSESQTVDRQHDTRKARRWLGIGAPAN